MARANVDGLTGTALAYWSRPYRARIETTEFSATFAFDTLGDAIDYIFQQAALTRGRSHSEMHLSGWCGSYVEGDDFRWYARDILLVERVSTF